MVESILWLGLPGLVLIGLELFLLLHVCVSRVNLFARKLGPGLHLAMRILSNSPFFNLTILIFLIFEFPANTHSSNFGLYL